MVHTNGDKAVQGDDKKQLNLEVEQKFLLVGYHPEGSNVDDKGATNDNGIETRLTSLGFEKSGPPKTMIDWYYDLPAPHWTLTIQDQWLRYRQVEFVMSDGETKKKACWELKIGQRTIGNTHATTVYEEIEGDLAVHSAIKILNESSYGALDTPTKEIITDKTTQPQFPTNCENSSLIPFARIETLRSSWSPSSKDVNNLNFVGLSIDLDVTDFGYAVGEVEAVVHSQDDVPLARERIASLISMINSSNDGPQNGESASSTPIGKLEYFLMTAHPEHYNALHEAG
eukprot:CAMPEP_0198296956 /NCGR_PEP_ID=MMETSP1449-20131203/34694_1 /TAXON_ID=420275 /ORGANISM="Attheya septentrionalis, Strain CCMP2084" /LENGTH=284 /DNA_ID=CAMNT_0043997721 /DNA_START=155 /DNA_END=1005 /DNA_ORIENTATION=+